ncbi:DUF6644 family protein [Pelagibacterium nitratireducens]|jgi:hypothetical protein|uniref:DUF6644 family protein n=1 Tax=Pelagibacterium nitratireducens TaxID=1046114 RepID=A0ABZ2I3C2_9HYPH|tara:strand:+ start:773 stop:1351 length:579 start_codon:yes stop_codon:yes gene_type:complete
MDFYSFFAAIENSAIGVFVRETLNVLPIVNVFHVLGIALVFGTIFMVDMRLIGLQSVTRPVSRVANDLLKWTWIGFALAVVTGLLMFAANATTFYINLQFQLKMVALAFAGLNMVVFELITARNMANWDTERRTPPAARFAGFASISIWALVIILGRWIGYTKGFNFSAPPPADLDLDNLFGAISFAQTAIG